ncbi:hypothetical protein K2X83_01380 [Patescibacteria group bacterium]|nr:hypothetical protein [Patescibacteria group bacterium]
MNPFDALLAKFNINLSDRTKTAIIIVVGLLVAFLAFGFLKSSFESFMYRGGVGMGGGLPGLGAPSMPGPMPMWQGGSNSYMMSEPAVADYAVVESGKGMALGMPMFSARNAESIYPPRPGGSTGNTAEAYEVSDYSASIETTDLKNTCAEIAALKSKKEVIFESASESETNCFYSFKVEHASVEAVLDALKSLNPRDLSENTYTIKQQLDDFTSETDILKKKLESIESTLTKALASYDEVARLAAQTSDAEALASIINSKVMTIERLTQERISINQQLEYLARAKEQAADRLNYAFFNVSVYKNEYVDGKALGDSWKAAVQQFFNDANRAVQGITILLLSLALWALQYVLYFLLLVVIVKYGWKFAVAIWKK